MKLLERLATLESRRQRNRNCEDEPMTREEAALMLEFETLPRGPDGHLADTEQSSDWVTRFLRCVGNQGN